jgi:DNA-binding transcriptional regulator YhcF (GntR family)
MCWEARMKRTVAQPDPPYLRIVAEIRRRITSGQLRAGDRVPSTRQITQQWGVAIATATKVLTTLRQEGLVRATPGIGTVVAAPEAHPAPPPRTGRRRDTREPDRELTRDRIAQTAIRIADTEGLPALSMRRVAAGLGVATMSLYRHIAGKDELILLMSDAVFDEERLPEVASPGWRAQLEELARLQWAIYRRHPWLAQVASNWFTRPPLTPHGMAHTEWAMRAVDGFGLDPATALYVAVTLAGYVQGTAVKLVSEVEAEHDTGITSDQWMQTQDSTFAAIMTSGQFPMLSSIAAQPDADIDLERLFEFGLQWMLDGLAAFLHRAPSG